MEDRCVCCGEIVPEGRQVCPSCEAGDIKSYNKNVKIKDKGFMSKLKNLIGKRRELIER